MIYNLYTILGERERLFRAPNRVFHNKLSPVIYPPPYIPCYTLLFFDLPLLSWNLFSLFHLILSFLFIFYLRLFCVLISVSAFADWAMDALKRLKRILFITTWRDSWWNIYAAAPELFTHVARNEMIDLVQQEEWEKGQSRGWGCSQVATPMYS